MTRILLVDDNPAVRRFLRGVLEAQADWMVCDEAGDGAEAVERARQHHPDLVLLDFQMPVKNGLEAAREITSLAPETPILMITMYLSKQLMEEAQKAGIRGTCEKAKLGCVVDAAKALLRHETYFPN